MKSYDIIELVVTVTWMLLLGWSVYMLGYQSGEYDGRKQARKEQREKEVGNDQLPK
jgi:hypothetical protein